MNRQISFGISVYVHTYEQQKSLLNRLESEDVYIFTSLHIMEEVQEGIVEYVRRVKTMLNELKQEGFLIIADVSQRSLDIFECPTLEALKESLNIDILRIDYGFEVEELLHLADSIPIALNASTMDVAAYNKRLKAKIKPLAMHNYYPRPETGLDEVFFTNINHQLKKNGFEIAAFIANASNGRSPLYEGLPTMEKHRDLNPYVAFIQMAHVYGVDKVLLADLDIGKEALQWILDYVKEGIIPVPMDIDNTYNDLYNQPFTIRKDSGMYAYRLVESREYSTKSQQFVKPENCIRRERGMLTMDNERYLRYSGEIQFMFESRPEDERVNVIGKIANGYYGLLDAIGRGDRIRFVRCNNKGTLKRRSD